MPERRGWDSAWLGERDSRKTLMKIWTEKTTRTSMGDFKRVDLNLFLQDPLRAGVKKILERQGWEQKGARNIYIYTFFSNSKKDNSLVCNSPPQS